MLTGGFDTAHAAARLEKKKMFLPAQMQETS
jgi:hypothetical protein